MNDIFDPNKFLKLRVRHDETFNEVYNRLVEKGKKVETNSLTGLVLGPSNPWGNITPHRSLVYIDYVDEIRKEKKYFKDHNYAV